MKTHYMTALDVSKDGVNRQKLTNCSFNSSCSSVYLVFCNKY